MPTIVYENAFVEQTNAEERGWASELDPRLDLVVL